MMLLFAALPALVGVTLFVATLRLSPRSRRSAPRLVEPAAPLSVAEPILDSAPLQSVRLRRRSLQRAA